MVSASASWARTTSEYSNRNRIRDAVAALPVDSGVLDGEAVVFRSDSSSSDFEALKSLQAASRSDPPSPMTSWRWTGEDVRPERLEERRKRLAKLLRAKPKARGDGIQLSEAITGDGGRHLSACLRYGPRRHRLKVHRLPLRRRSGPGHG